MKRQLPIAIAGLMGLLMLVEYFFEWPAAKDAAAEMQNWVIVVAAFALALAAINLFLSHVRSVERRGPGAIHSVVLLVAMVVTTIVGVARGPNSDSFRVIFDAILTPLASAFYAMACFHVASAAYRAFRASNAQSAALLITGVLMMLGRAPIGEAMSAQFPVIANWIMEVPNLAGNRGIMMTSALGMVSVGLRVMLGIDRSHLGIGPE